MSTSRTTSRFPNRMKNEMNRKNNHRKQTERQHELNEAAERFIDRIRKEDAIETNEIDASWREVMRQIKTDERSLRPAAFRRILWPMVSIAASVALLWGGYRWLQHLQPEESNGLQPSLLSQMDTMPTDQIVLHTGSQRFFLDDDASVSYTEEGDVTADELKLDGEETSVGDNLNQLFVPYGTHADVTLSDGTRICVNAGSKLIYPRTFEGKQREVLLEGEAYLEVAPNAQAPFIVKTNGMDIRVLGTQFNVQAYRDAEDVSVVLVQGSVEVNMSDTEDKVLLKPDERFVKDKNGIRVDEVDVSEYISWKNNVLIVKGKPVGGIFHQLERFYGCRIHVDDETAARLLSGKLDLASDVREVVESICLSLSLRYQCINEHEIHIETANSNMFNP